MLAVVEHKENLALDHVLDKGVEQRPPGLLRYRQRGRDRLRDQRLIGDRGQLGQPGAVAIFADRGSGELERQPRLPNSTRAGDGEQARALQQVAELAQLRLAADESGQRVRKVVPALLQRRQRRKLDRVMKVSELEDMLRANQVLQPVQAEVDQLHTRRPLVGQQLLSSPRQHHLARVADGEQTGTAVQRGAVVMAAAQLSFAGVERDPDPQRAFGVEATLDVEGAAGRVRGGTEDGQHAVTLAAGLDQPAGVTLNRAADDRVMARHRPAHALRVAVPKASRPRQVGEQEGKRSFGQLGHARMTVADLGGDRTFRQPPSRETGFPWACVARRPGLPGRLSLVNGTEAPR